MTLKSIHSHSIPNGTKLVAFYADGSGAMLFMVDDNGDLYNAEFTHYGSAPDTYLIDADKTGVEGHDVFKDMDSWSSRRIEELQSWKRHHRDCIEKIDEDIKRLSGYSIDYDEFMKQIRGRMK